MMDFNPFRYLVATTLPGGNNSDPLPKFKMGDKVYHSPSGNKGTVANPGDFGANTWIYFISFDNSGSSYVKEYELAPLAPDAGPPEWKWGNYKCECGAQTTYGPDAHHSVWCPKYRG